MKKLIQSFAPIAFKGATVLILGSMPSERSLAVNQYYAHPRNAFWTVMQEVTGVDHTASYKERVRSLHLYGIALWDVLHSCYRKGSLDAAIESGSIKVNDFNTFLHMHPHIRVVLFNGATAERYYRRYALAQIENEKIEYIRMPSTSPAHAALSLEQKVNAWRNEIVRQIALRGR
jgi:double-stranded uracil-DNA glycosylase